jgi:hypothetical protein
MNSLENIAVFSIFINCDYQMDLYLLILYAKISLVEL